jgi:SOS-response transcriptional repressor LexA
VDWRSKLRKVIEDRGLDMKSVSLGSGLNAAGVQQILGGKDPRASTLLRILEHLQLSFDELMTGAVPSIKPKSVAVVGETAAGQWLEPDSWDEAKYPPVPFVPTRYAELEQRAYRVVGPSMNLHGIHDGTFVITVRYWEVRTQPQDGDVVVVERRRDGGLVERTLKEVVIRPEHIELTSRSSDDRFKEPIVIPRHLSESPIDPVEVEIVALVIGCYSPIG